MASIPGEITFAINSRLLTQGVTASDAEVGTAVGFAFRELKLVVEPGGAVGLAALLAGRIDVGGKNVVIVLSGGNVDADLFAQLIRLIFRSREERDLLGLAHAPDRRQRIGRRCIGPSQDPAGDQRRAERSVQAKVRRRFRRRLKRGFNGRRLRRRGHRLRLPRRRRWDRPAATSAT